ncbi:MAG: hypothetical protein LBT90_01285 [Holosporaceae bacterium]|jgi:hypothetical protein|nr:hypothetical protein [Holosporaceae bacterium]
MNGIRFFRMVMVCACVFVVTLIPCLYGIVNIMDAASSMMALTPATQSFEKAYPLEGGIGKFVKKIIDKIKCGDIRGHISLVIINSGKRSLVLPYVFTSGSVGDWQKDLFGIVALPFKFSDIFKNIACFGYSCNPYAEKVPHSERAACLFLVNEIKDIFHDATNITVTICNIKSACDVCQAFLNGRSHYSRTTNP